MGDDEVKALQARVAELTQQLQEQRDDFEFDLKASRETSEATIKKLEEEIARLQKAGTPSGAVGREVEALTQRALLAERRVAELQQEVQRARNQASSLSPAPRDNPALVQRAEAAEKERDGLRKDLHTAQRELEDARRALARAEEQGREASEQKRQLADLRRELEEARQQARKAEQGGEGLQHRADLARLEAELRERQLQLESSQARVRELSDRVRELGTQVREFEGIQASRDALAAERDALSRELDATCDRVAALERERDASRRGSGEGKGERGQVARLESELASLKSELAQTRMASGQMADHRDREVERLKSSLKSVEGERGEALGQVEGLRAELERVRARLEREVGVLRLERDQAVAELQRLRNREPTAVGDPFDVKTVRVTLGAVAPRAGGEERTQPQRASSAPPPPVDEVPAVPGELVAAPERERGGFGQADPVSPEEREARSASFARGSTTSGTGGAPDTLPEFLSDPELQVDPSAPSPDAERLVPIESLDGGGVLAGEPPAPPEEGPAVDQAQAEPASAAAEEPAAAPAPRQDATVLRGKPLPRPQPPLSPVRTRPPQGGGMKKIFVAIGAVAAACLLVVGAWHFFPRWFGTQVDDEGETTAPVADAAAGAGTEPADAGVVVSGGEDAGDNAAAAAEDAGIAAGAGEDAGAAPAEVDGPAVAIGSDAVEAPVEGVDAGAPAPEAYQPDAAVLAARDHGLKLLQKKKYGLALAHLGPWVKRAPRDPVMHYLHGRALFYEKKSKPAAAALQEATRLDPGFADAYYELGGVYLGLKDEKRARQALEKFLELKPKDRRARAVEQLLKKLR